MQDYSGYGQPPYGGYGATSPLPPMPPRPPRGRISLLSYVAVALVAGALGAGSVVALYHPASNSTATAPPSSRAVAPQPLPTGAIPQPSNMAPGPSLNAPGVVSKVEPGLVIINTALRYNSEQAAGTGMVITSGGLVLTNNHVIEDSTKITATVVSTGRTYQARVVGYDVTGDIALIQMEGVSGLHTITPGNSATLTTGQTVVAMGNAEGQSMIVPATGEITALNQTITASNEGGSISSETLHGMIETNANIVSGDSGGPLANTSGEVIGMDTAGNSVRFGEQTTAGFAIPINTALAIAQEIRAGQASSTVTIGYPPFMGIYIPSGPAASDSSPQGQANDQAQGNGYGGYGGYGGGFGGGYGGGGFGGSGNGSSGCVTSNVGVGTPSSIAPVSSGTLIVGVICGGPAAGAGMSAGSVITAVNGQAIGSPNDLTGVVSKYAPGTTISVTWVSPSGQRTTSSIHLTSGPPQ
jgi:S1-C subfamily serine protease